MLEAADRTVLATSEHSGAILSIRTLFYTCVQPVEAVEKDCSKVSCSLTFHLSKIVNLFLLATENTENMMHNIVGNRGGPENPLGPLQLHYTITLNMSEHLETPPIPLYKI